MPSCSPEHTDLNSALTHSKLADSTAAQQSSAVSDKLSAADEPDATSAAAAGTNGWSKESAPTGEKRLHQKAAGYQLRGRSPWRVVLRSSYSSLVGSFVDSFHQIYKPVW